MNRLDATRSPNVGASIVIDNKDQCFNECSTRLISGWLVVVLTCFIGQNAIKNCRESRSRLRIARISWRIDVGSGDASGRVITCSK